jgi:phosphatidylglycerophosphate synthase
MPAEEGDYLFPKPGYIEFERFLVGFLRNQDFILPNHLTYFRFVICLFLIFFFRELSYLQILFLALIGALSDFLDGALARAASKKTRLGMLIDPIADKCLAFTLIGILLVKGDIGLSYLIMMVVVESHVMFIPVFSWLYRGKKADKERVSGREVIDERPLLFKSKEILLGKIKTFFYAVGLLGIFAAGAAGSPALSSLARGLLLTGIVIGGIALLKYLIGWIRNPYDIYQP